MHHYCCFQGFILLFWRLYMISQVKKIKVKFKKVKQLNLWNKNQEDVIIYPKKL